MIRILSLVWVILLGVTFGLARPVNGSKVDSLTKVIDTTTSLQERIQLLGKLATVQRSTNLLEAIKTTEKAANLARQIGSDTLVIMMKDKLAFYHFLHKDYQKSLAIGRN